MEVKVKDSAKGLPLSLLAEKTLYLRVENKIYEDKFKAFTTEAFHEKFPDMKVSKVQKSLEIVHQSEVWQNYLVNLERYSREFSCEFYNTQFSDKENKMILEF
jgi:hypothetical protein